MIRTDLAILSDRTTWLAERAAREANEVTRGLQDGSIDPRRALAGIDRVLEDFREMGRRIRDARPTTVEVGELCRSLSDDIRRFCGSYERLLQAAQEGNRAAVENELTTMQLAVMGMSSAGRRERELLTR